MLLSYRSAAIALSILAASAVASSPSAFAKDDDHRQIREALDKGDIRPLADILSVHGTKLPGTVIEAELDEKRGKWVYEFKLIDDKGAKSKVRVDAKSGEVQGTDKAQNR